MLNSQLFSFKLLSSLLSSSPRYSSYYTGIRLYIQFQNIAASSSAGTTWDAMTQFINGFLAASLGLLAIQLLFSLIGVPFDRKFLPLRTDMIKRTDNAISRPFLLLVLYFVQDVVCINILHLGGVLSASFRAGDSGCRESVPSEQEI